MLQAFLGVHGGRLLLCLPLLWLSGCTSLMSDLDPPTINIENVRSLPTAGTGPRFEITLRIANPNKQALEIAGISYAMDLLGRELVTGVTNEVPRIAPYTEETVTLEAGVNLLQVLRLLGDLGRGQGEVLEYRFRAKIDFEGFLPTQRVEESGTLALN